MIDYLKKYKQYREKSFHDIEKIYVMSFLWSMGTLMVTSILPIFMIDVIKVSHLQIGMIEGFAIGFSFAVKISSGIISDFLKNRKWFIFWGSVLTFFTKSVFALSTNFFLLFLGRSLDRFSKGVRGAPTDALLADLCQSEFYGRSYGKRQSYSTLGAVVGALLAMLILYVSPQDYRFVFWLSTIPCVLGCLIAHSLKSPLKISRKIDFDSLRSFFDIDLKRLNQLPKVFWLVLVMTFFLMTARFSEAFVILQAKDLGFSIVYIPLLMVCLDLFHSMVALPFGHLADHYSKKIILLVGIIFFSMTHYIFYMSNNISHIIVGIICIGVHLGMTQGVLKAVVAECVPSFIKGTGFSVFYLVSGLGIIIGNTLAGYVSQTYGLKYIFIFGFISTIIACSFLIGFLYYDNTRTHQYKPLKNTD